MREYDLFKMIYYALDNQYDLNKNEELGNFLSLMNPFLFKEEGSADPAIYENFKKEFNNRFNNECTSEEGYYFAKEWLDIQKIKVVKDSFDVVSLEEWNNAVNS